MNNNGWGDANAVNQLDSITSTDAIKDRLPTTVGQKPTAISLSTCRSSTVGDYDMSGRTDIALASSSTKLLTTASGEINSVSKSMGNFGGTQVQLKVDANGILETSGGGGGGGGGVQYPSDSVLPAIVTGTAMLGEDFATGLAEVATVNDIGTGNAVLVELGEFVKGQDTMANSLPVVLASDQSVLDVNNGFSASTEYGIDAGATLQAQIPEIIFTAYTNMTSSSRVMVYGTTTNKTDPIYMMWSKSQLGAGPYYKDWENPINIDPVTGNFCKQFSNLSGNYFKLSKANSTTLTETIKILTNTGQ